MGHVDNSQIAPLFANTTPGVTADANAVDPAISALIVAINENFDSFESFKASITLPIPDQSIVERHLRNLAVTNPKLAPLAVTADKIADGTITTAKIMDMVITAQKIANNAILERHMSNASVSRRTIQAGAVGANEIDPTILNPISDATINVRLNKIDEKFTDVATIYARDYGVTANGVTDDTAAMVSAITDAISKLPCTIKLPKGVICFSDIGDLAYEGLTLEGLSDKATILQCISTVPNHNAISYNGFRFGTTTDQFVLRCNLKNVQVRGNSNTENIFFLQGIAMANWENITAAVANSVRGKAYHLKSVMLSHFKNVSVSANLNNISPFPYYGMYIDEGTRGGNLAGNSTNNTFTGCYYESVNTGCHIERGDQNVFIGGAMEGCSNIGLIIPLGNSRMNTFIGVGFEKNFSGIDVKDNGRMTQYINCYCDHRMEIDSQFGTKVSGGLYGSIRLTNLSRNNHIENLRVNYHGPDEGGMIDEGTNNIIKNVQSLFDNSFYKAPMGVRTAISVGSSPFIWTNNTGMYVQVIMQTGTVSQVLGKRSGSSDHILPNASPSWYLVAPGDSLSFAYSVAPGLSYVPLNDLKW